MVNINYRTLIANGCSHTYGAETTGDGRHSNLENINWSWSAYLSRAMGISNYVNLSECGQPNQSIYFKTVDYLLKAEIERPALLIIQWSYLNRVSYYRDPMSETYISPGIYSHSVKCSDPDSLPNDIKEFETVYTRYFAENVENHISWVFNNIALTKIAQNIGIDYVFYNSSRLDTNRIPPQYRQHVGRFDNMLLELGSDWYHDLTVAGYKRARDGHFLRDGHEYWANILHDKIKKRSLNDRS